MMSRAMLCKSRVLVVEDNAFTRESVIRLINSQADMVCSGEADSLAFARLAVAAKMPDLNLLDIHLRDEAFDLISSLNVIAPRRPILVYSMYDELVYGRKAFQVGARGYVAKQTAAEDLLGAIRALLVGRIYFNRTIADNRPAYLDH